MKEFLLLFRGEYEAMPQRDEPQEWQATAKKWQDWIGGIAAQDRWVAAGQRLSPGGKVVRTDGVITDGPYTLRHFSPHFHFEAMTILTNRPGT